MLFECNAMPYDMILQASEKFRDSMVWKQVVVYA
jgi:hypothetical protein